ncbi:unnamed protein product [Cunninghamella blakesleeana]
MKFSIISAATIVLASVASVSGDALADAVKKFCGGLSVTNPTGGSFTPGSTVKVVVHNTPGEYQKYIQALQLFQITPDKKFVSVQNVWQGDQFLNTEGYLETTLANNLGSGDYYYRLWVNNKMNGGRGPDCTPQSSVFQIVVPSHTNEDGSQAYEFSLDDANIYDKTHGAGCYGITLTQSGLNKDNHIVVSINRNIHGSETDSIEKIELWKNVNGEKTKVHNVVPASKQFSIYDNFITHDHILDNQIDPNAKYFYQTVGNNNQGSGKCTFNSPEFSISPKN